MAESSSSFIGRFVRAYAVVVDARKQIIIIGWIVFLYATAPFAPGLISATSQQLSPPLGSAAHIASNALAQHFFSRGVQTQFVVLLCTRDGSPVLASVSARNASEMLETAARAHELTANMAGFYPLFKQGIRAADLR